MSAIALQSLLLRSYLPGMPAVLEEIAAVRRHHGDLSAAMPRPLDQPELLQCPSRLRAGGICVASEAAAISRSKSA